MWYISGITDNNDFIVTNTDTDEVISNVTFRMICNKFLNGDKYAVGVVKYCGIVLCPVSLISLKVCYAPDGWYRTFDDSGLGHKGCFYITLDNGVINLFYKKDGVSTKANSLLFDELSFEANQLLSILSVRGI